MGLYEQLGIQDRMSDAELATYLSAERRTWNVKAASLNPKERELASLRVRQIDALSGTEARLGNFQCPALVMKTLCSAIDHQYSDYYGLEEALVNSCSRNSFRGEFRSVLAYLEQIGEAELVQEWKDTLEQLGVEYSMPRRKTSSGERSTEEQRSAGRKTSERQGERSGSGKTTERQRERSENSKTAGAPSRKKKAASSAGRQADNRGYAAKDAAGRTLHRMKRKWKKLISSASRGGLPIRLIGAAAVVIVAVVIIIAMMISNITQQQKAAAEQKAQEEAAAAASQEAAEAAEAEQKAQEELLASLQGMDNYVITTDTSTTEGLAKISPSACTASSTLVGSSGTSYGTEYLFDEDLTTSWQEGEEDDGLGVTITSEFGEQISLQAIAIWNGNETAQDRYESNNRLQDITVTITCEGQSYSKQYTLEDVMGEQILSFKNAVPAESVTIQIDTVYKGTVYQDTVISEMAFFE